MASQTFGARPLESAGHEKRHIVLMCFLVNWLLKLLLDRVVTRSVLKKLGASAILFVCLRITGLMTRNPLLFYEPMGRHRCSCWACQNWKAGSQQRVCWVCLRNRAWCLMAFITIRACGMAQFYSACVLSRFGEHAGA